MTCYPNEPYHRISIWLVTLGLDHGYTICSAYHFGLFNLRGLWLSNFVYCSPYTYEWHHKNYFSHKK